MIVHNAEIGRRLKPRYSAGDIRDLLALLIARGTLDFKPLPSGLYPAANLDATAAARSGYGNVWVRDNIYVALAYEVAGDTAAARSVVAALAAFYRKHRGRFAAIVKGEADPARPMNRPHVRFDGVNLAENPETWAQAQNDALGYFLWAYCRMASKGQLAPDRELLALFALYFQRIRYWEDEDSGHWEEARKVEASSIGAVVAGLRALRDFAMGGARVFCEFEDRALTPDLLDELVGAGERALAEILPAECVQPVQARRHDAALLFLAYPLDVAGEAMGRGIVDDVLAKLQGDYGIRRYPGDSYWTADYKDKLPPGRLTAEYSERQSERDALARQGEEAQWCIFDPIVSVIAGRRYRRSRDPADLDQQVRHLNRSLGQITGEGPHAAFRCPEAYYLEHGRYVPNDQTPLLWTQANLWLALSAMANSASA
jgi:phosphorylase kinase alpha/beta subunit